MATHELIKIEPNWGDAYTRLDYVTEPFNNSDDTTRWLAQGYSNKFTGAMCDMRKSQPIWNSYILAQFEQRGWKDVCTSYYRMDTGTTLPVHYDIYKRYVELFNLQGKEQTIHRAIVFLEDWQSGHYLEINGEPIVKWSAGDTVIWQYDAPHMAANMGLLPRYTLQITGHMDEIKQ